MTSNSPLSTSLLLSETHIGRIVQISERIRWAKIPGQDKIIWWPCILYKSFMELMSDLDERLVMFRNNCRVQQRKTQSNEPAVAYFLGFYPPLVRTFKNYSCYPAPQEGEDTFRLDKEGMNRILQKAIERRNESDLAILKGTTSTPITASIATDLLESARWKQSSGDFSPCLIVVPPSVIKNNEVKSWGHFAVSTFHDTEIRAEVLDQVKTGTTDVIICGRVLFTRP